ncbi:uncharacterized protein BcabD6B2_42960 [Babesia caballi]|uniref:Uncharacterized protein n=1 Tax=Babesia caballi TaxID=5871 RepID=A0AAV4LXD8_BABCB|nr:hypothetical protein BcabD6B2_42960 [Babesia caballi]
MARQVVRGQLFILLEGTGDGDLEITTNNNTEIIKQFAELRRNGHSREPIEHLADGGGELRRLRTFGLEVPRCAEE